MGVAVDDRESQPAAQRHVDAVPGGREREGARVVGDRHEGHAAAAQRVDERNAGVARDGDQVAPARSGDVAAELEGPARGRLIGPGGDEARRVLRHDRDDALVGGAEQIARHAAQRLRPREAGAAREGDHLFLRVYGEQRPVGAEGRLLDVGRHRVGAAALQVEGEELVLGGADVEERRLGVDAHHALDGGESPAQRVRDLGQAGETIEPGNAAPGGEPDSDRGHPADGPARCPNCL